MVPIAAFPSANRPFVVMVPRTNMLAAVFPPAQRNSSYEVRSVIAGARPDSLHAIERVPAAVHDPARGFVNKTSANAVLARVLRRKKGTRLKMRMVWELSWPFHIDLVKKNECECKLLRVCSRTEKRIVKVAMGKLLKCDFRGLIGSCTCHWLY
jgi:hypothetical protein